MRRWIISTRLSAREFNDDENKRLAVETLHQLLNKCVHARPKVRALSTLVSFEAISVSDAKKRLESIVSEAPELRSDGFYIEFYELLNESLSKSDG